MSGDTEPVIHTVGSVDKHDQTKLGDEIPTSTDDVSTDDVLPNVSDSKLDHTERRREKAAMSQDLDHKKIPPALIPRVSLVWLAKSRRSAAQNRPVEVPRRIVE